MKEKKKERNVNPFKVELISTIKHYISGNIGEKKKELGIVVLY